MFRSPGGPAITARTASDLWRALQPTADEIRSARRRLHLKAVGIAGLLAVSYYALVISNFGVLLRLASAGVMILAVVALATGVMHDANHGSFSRHRFVNRVLAYTSDALGASSWLWRFQHNVLHHGNTNVAGIDADLDLAPWARVAPSQPWRRRFRWQHLYMWPLYGFLALRNLIVSDVVSLIRGRVGDQPLRRKPTKAVIARLVLGKIGHLAWAVFVPLLFNPWWAVLTFYLVSSWLVGLTLAVIFQLAHCVDVAEMPSAERPRRGHDFAMHQLQTTANIASPLPVVGHLFRWIAGGLDHQIEHHLSPGLPHTIYPKLARKFRAACLQHGLTYRRHSSVWEAMCSHTRWLRAMGQPAPIALDQKAA